MSNVPTAAVKPDAAPEPEPPVIVPFPKLLYKLEVHPPPPPPPQPAPEVEIHTKVVNDEEEEKKATGEGWSKDVPKVEANKLPKGPYVPIEDKPAHAAGQFPPHNGEKDKKK